MTTLEQKQQESEAKIIAAASFEERQKYIRERSAIEIKIKARIKRKGKKIRASGFDNYTILK